MFCRSGIGFYDRFCVDQCCKSKLTVGSAIKLVSAASSRSLALLSKLVKKVFRQILITLAPKDKQESKIYL